jgi:hypothetical protein
MVLAADWAAAAQHESTLVVLPVIAWLTMPPSPPVASSCC